jgi:hypothetical protein
MSDTTSSAPSMPVTALRHFARQLTPMQGKSLLAAIVATVAGFVGSVYTWIERRGDGSAPAWADWLGQHALGWGLAFIVAFVVFFVIRRFVLRALGVLALVIAAAAAVSYFTGLNLDLSRARQAYDTAAGWTWAQGNALVDLITRNLGGTASAMAGGFFGGRKPR